MDDIDVLAFEMVEDIVGLLVLFQVFESLEAMAKLKNFNKLAKKGQLWKKGNQGRNGAADMNSCFNSIPGFTALRSSSYCGKLSLT